MDRCRQLGAEIHRQHYGFKKPPEGLVIDRRRGEPGAESVSQYMYWWRLSL